MHTTWDADLYETVVHSRPCTACAGGSPCQPGRCNGSIAVSQRARSSDEVLRIKAERKRKEEDEILARAEVIRQQRAQVPS